MNQSTIYIDPTGCSEVGWTQAAGMPGDTRFHFRTPGNLPYTAIVALSPQLVLRPQLTFDIHAYDITIDDPTGAAGVAIIPGSVMVDRFRIEVYERNSIGQPQRMLAAGRVAISGEAYTSSSPLSPASYSQGPAGPAGPPGPPGTGGTGDGTRGSRWYTGAGPPGLGIPDTRVEGDMYLDENTGDVYRWDATTAAWRAKGV